ncbi:MAG: MBL fold metallo-hydrolase [Anaerolineae bacterium]|nr:MBL fold metallo-hydrolase [Anaerolineae bacterium]
MRIRFWGVRGTIPTPGPDTIKYGGNTSCVEVTTGDKQLIIIDAGSGIRHLGKELLKNTHGRITASILISHTHWDHIQGFPFFSPIFGRNNRFVVVGKKRVGKQLEETMAGQFIEPYLPFSYNSLPADLIVKEVGDHETLIIGDDTKVTVADLNHPGGCLGFRIESNGVVFVYCSDVSHYDDGFDQNLLKLAQDADLLVHDSHFGSLEERKRFSEYGHSSWIEAAQAAIEARVGCLALFHYSPDLTDAELDEIIIKAREVFPKTILTREGMEITLPLHNNQLPE